MVLTITVQKVLISLQIFLGTLVVLGSLALLVSVWPTRFYRVREMHVMSIEKEECIPTVVEGHTAYMFDVF